MAYLSTENKTKDGSIDENSVSLIYCEIFEYHHLVIIKLTMFNVVVLL
jgi:hypothetical protein